MKFKHITMAALTTLIAAPVAAAPSPAASSPARPATVRLAQAGPAAPQGKRMRPNHQKRAKIRQRIRALRAWRLTEALNLDEKSAMRLFPVLNRYDDLFVKHAQAGGKLRKDLRLELKRPVANKLKINQLIDQTLKHQRDGFRLRRARFGELRKALSPAQAAKLMVVLPQIDRRIEGQIRRAMRQGGNARKRGGQGKWRGNPYGGGPRRRGRSGRFKNPFDDGPPAGTAPRGRPGPAPRQPLKPGF